MRLGGFKCERLELIISSKGKNLSIHLFNRQFLNFYYFSNTLVDDENIVSEQDKTITWPPSTHILVVETNVIIFN